MLQQEIHRHLLSYFVLRQSQYHKEPMCLMNLFKLVASTGRGLRRFEHVVVMAMSSTNMARRLHHYQTSSHYCINRGDNNNFLSFQAPRLLSIWTQYLLPHCAKSSSLVHAILSSPVLIVLSKSKYRIHTTSLHILEGLTRSVWFPSRDYIGFGHRNFPLIKLCFTTMPGTEQTSKYIQSSSLSH